MMPPIQISSGLIGRLMTRVSGPWERSDVAGRIYERGGCAFNVAIRDPEAGLVASIKLGGDTREIAAPQLQDLVARALPDPHDLRFFDAVTHAALSDRLRDGGFWYHPFSFVRLFGLAGRDGRGHGVDSCERKRLRRRLERLEAIQLSVMKRDDDQPLEKITGPIVGRRKETGKSVPERGRPRDLLRYGLNALIFAEAKRWHISAPSCLFTLPPGPLYKLVRHALVRAHMRGELNFREPIARFLTYAGLEDGELGRAVDMLRQTRLLGLQVTVCEDEIQVAVRQDFGGVTPPTLGVSPPGLWGCPPPSPQDSTIANQGLTQGPGVELRAQRAGGAGAPPPADGVGA